MSLIDKEELMKDIQFRINQWETYQERHLSENAKFEGLCKQSEAEQILDIVKATKSKEVISPVTLGCMISAFIEGDMEKALTYVEFIEQKYQCAGNESAAEIIKQRRTGEYMNSKVDIDEIIRNTKLKNNSNSLPKQKKCLNCAHCNDAIDEWFCLVNDEVIDDENCYCDEWKHDGVSLD